MRLLTRSDVQRSVSMRDAVEVVKRAFSALSTGRADVPIRISVSQPEHEGVTLVMPGHLREDFRGDLQDSESLAVKLVSVHNRNAERNLPLINAVVIVIDPATGQAVATMEGGYLTALRAALQPICSRDRTRRSRRSSAQARKRVRRRLPSPPCARSNASGFIRGAVNRSKR